MLLSVNDLSLTYPDGRRVLSGVSFDLGGEGTVAVVGPSGCGKTTLLYLLGGLLAPTSGRVLLEGRVVARPTPRVGIILQDYGLLPWKTVLDNVALGLKVQGLGRAERRARAGRLLLDMGLAGREQDFPECLSGGERQRVAIARAYAAGASLLLMDEPFSSLDALTREKLQDTLLASWERSRLPYVLVTHSVEEAVVLGRRILLLGGSPATILASFDNPGFGAPGLRRSRDYFDQVARVRAAMEELWQG